VDYPLSRGHHGSTMGLKIHSLGELPAEASRGYYVYLLDYGWEEPLGRALRDNFDQMADVASRHDAAVILGLGNEFNDQGSSSRFRFVAMTEMPASSHAVA